MKKVLSYLRQSRRDCILAPLFKLLEVVFELLVPLIMAQMIDQGIGKGDEALILRLSLYLFLLAAVGLISAISAQFFAARAATGFAARLKSALFRHIYSLSFLQIDTLRVPTLITRMTGDVNQVQSGVNLALRLALRSPFVVFGAMIMALTVDIQAALVMVVIIPILSVTVALIMWKTLPKYKQIQQASDGVLGVTRENLSGVRVIRAFGKEESEREQFAQKHDALTTLQLKTQRISSLLNPLTFIIVDIGLAVLIHVGAIRVNAGLLTQGEVVALINYMAQILVELVKLANLIIVIAKSIASASRIESLLNMQGNTSWGDSAPDMDKETLIEYDNVSLSFEGEGKEALSDISFTLKKGETLGIIGGTGAGKSLLISLLPRFYDATKGCVKLGGQDVRNLSQEALRTRIGVVPQHAQLFRGTVRTNLLMGDRNANEQDMIAALKTAQAYAFVMEKEGALDAPIEQGGKNLSGGQRQRLTIARALVRKPDILILDDSASALDAQTDYALRRALVRDVKCTTIIISQRASSVINADKILVLEDGVAVGLGTHQTLMDTCPVYRETYEAQFPKEAV